MSEQHDHAGHDWIDEWWPVGLIAFGVACIFFVGCYTARW